MLLLPVCSGGSRRSSFPPDLGLEERVLASGPGLLASVRQKCSDFDFEGRGVTSCSAAVEKLRRSDDFWR